MTFKELNIIPPILNALEAQGYTNPTPIQQQAIPHVLTGKDLLGCAQTGTGKTAAFAIPVLQRLDKDRSPRKGRRLIKALIVTPTRELAIQIEDSFNAYGDKLHLKSTSIFGGVPQGKQVRILNGGIDILIATPGRLLDLMQQKIISLNDISILVLDEADRMLDMGFIHDMKKILARVPEKRQTLFFSATMPPEIQALANTILKDPAEVTVTPPSTTVEVIQQAVYFVDKKEKKKLLAHILQDESITRSLVFTRTKHGADRLVKDLHKSGIEAAAIHGNKSQGARQRALNDFKDNKIRVLVATDIAARGIDIDELPHVVNYELPDVPETYVHRIGRTGRAGADGIALSFCEAEERVNLKDIQKLIGFNLPVVDDHPYPAQITEPEGKKKKGGNRQQQQRRKPKSKPNNGSNNNSGNSNSNKPQSSYRPKRKPRNNKPNNNQ